MDLYEGLDTFNMHRKLEDSFLGFALPKRKPAKERLRCSYTWLTAAEQELCQMRPGGIINVIKQFADHGQQEGSNKKERL